MRLHRTLAVFMAFIMVLFTFPTTVFASEEAIQLGGELKLKGKTEIGTELSVDFSKVLPEDLTEDMVTFRWSRVDHEEAEEQKAFPEKERIFSTAKELGTEKKLMLTEGLEGYDILLQITAADGYGMKGSVTGVFGPVTVPETEEIPEDDQVLEEDTETAEPETPVYEEETHTEGYSGLEVTAEDPDDSFYASDPEGILDISVEETYSSEDPGVSVSGSEEESAEAMPEEELISEAAVDTQKVDFGTLEPSDESAYYSEQAQVVQVTNTGNTVLNFREIAPEHFMVADIEEPLLPDETVSLWVQPRAGLEPGSYTDLIAYASEEGAEVSYEASVVIEASADDTEESLLDDNEEDILMQVSGPEGSDIETIEEIGEEITETPGQAFDPSEEPAEDPGDDPENPGENSEDPGENPENPGENPENPGENPENPGENPENPGETPEPEEPYIAFTFTDGAYQALDFGKAEEGYTESPSPQIVVIQNSGNTAATLGEPFGTTGEFHVTTTAESLTLDPGATITFVIQPKNGLAAGDHADTISFYREGAEESILTTTVAFTVTKPEPVIAFAFTDNAYQELDFGEKEEGYTKLPGPQSVEIKNVGNTTATLAAPYSSYGNFSVSYTAKSLTLDPGAVITFVIQPKTGLTAGDRFDYINFYLEGAENSILTTTAAFTVTEPEVAEVKLVRVNIPSDITGVKNGTAKDADRLGLPAKVTIYTSDGKRKVPVKWDLQNCSYKPELKSAQTFQVTGKVTLPDDVTNPDKVSLKTTINVSVEEYQRDAITVSGSDNKITGITVNGAYEAYEGIHFQAVGAGMENTDPKVGDQRYLPLSCTVVKTYTWESAPYEATIRLHDAGDYTLKVVFQLQEYTKKGWSTVSGAQDTKTVDFRIVNSSATPTPTATVTPTPAGRNAVATGDDTPILPMVLILVGAAVAVGVVVLIIKKRK